MKARASAQKKNPVALKKKNPKPKGKKTTKTRSTPIGRLKEHHQFNIKKVSPTQIKIRVNGTCQHIIIKMAKGNLFAVTPHMIKIAAIKSNLPAKLLAERINKLKLKNKKPKN